MRLKPEHVPLLVCLLAIPVLFLLFGVLRDRKNGDDENAKPAARQLVADPDSENSYEQLTKDKAAQFANYGVGGMPMIEGSAVEDFEIVVLWNQGHVCAFSKKLKIPIWTCYRLGEERFPDYERHPEWKEDPRLGIDHDPGDFHYSESKKDRGHMAPSYGIFTRYGNLAMIDTFYMSNASPMSRRLNVGVWGSVERYVARADDCWANEKTEVWVICGPILRKVDGEYPKIARSGIVIPTAYWKVLVRDPNNKKLDPEQAESLAFIFPESGATEGTWFGDYTCWPDAIEAECSYLDLMPQLSEELENRLEGSNAKPQVWEKAAWE